MNSIGGKIKTIREKNHFTQKQLAEFLDCDQSYISKFENDERQFSIDDLEKICYLLGCTLNDIDNDTLNELQYGFRSTTINSKEDLIAISEINKIALNLRDMKKLLGEVSIEG